MRAALLFLPCLTALFLASASAAQTIKEDNYPLRASCSDAAETVALLKRGDPVRIRFSLTGNAKPCYAVSVETGGKTLQGYVPADGLTNLEAYEAKRRSDSAAAARALPVISRSEVESAREKAVEEQETGKTNYALAAQLNLAADALQSGRPADAERILEKAPAPPGQRAVALLRAYALLQLNQPDRALDVLEPALRTNKKDPQLFAAAGRAAYNLDDLPRALAYLKESLELKPDETLQKIYARIEREMSADKSGEKSYGMRFLLRYDNAVASPELARSMVDVLEQEFSRISFQLGCPADERIITIVQSREAYRQTTGAAEWSGGVYDGKIRIPLARTATIDPETRQTFAHEIVHACMANIGRWPTWLHEGVAQKLSGDALRPVQRDMLKTLARVGQLPKLEDLGNSWSGLNTKQAAIAYTLALAATELFVQQHGDMALRNLMNNPQSLNQITPELDKALAASLQ
ncbi:MAG TPA: hypothetical protein VFA54_03490 [Bryobacterales bacterium]|jgi:tetratricopeptide (TPR) repeat protein|nr:hypothetical protein [Bryobacterales bacterium]